MRHGLKLVAALLVHGFFLTSILGDGECPLNFKYLQNIRTIPDCYEPKVNDEFQSAACCVNAFVSYTKALAHHTNVTSGRPLFLNTTDQAACATQLSREKYLELERCSFQPPKFTAYTSPCLYGYESELLKVPLLSDRLSGIESMVHECSDLSDQGACLNCSAAFWMHQKILSILQNDTEVNCGMALLVSLSSHNIADADWTDRLYWCLELPFVATISGDKKHDLLVPLLSTLLGGVCLVGLCFLLIQLRHKYARSFDDESYVQKYNHNEAEGAVDHQEDSVHESMQKLVYDVPVVSQGSLYTFSAKELMKATDNFNSKNFIGEGSAGKVFKGALPSGQLVAIKHIMNEKKLDTFYKEVENLTKVRHTNLVTLLGYCQTPNEHLLVYEYCSKGNLWHYLFGNGPVLTWEQRINIAVGSAQGLWYLHLYPGGHIVHRDIKPTNILLNEHMEAKVSDFGLSRFIAMEESRVITEIKGTAGYLDPEYLSLGTLTFASDVYSFGIVLLELISGRRPIELSLNLTKRLPLVKLANIVVEGGEDLSQIVDPRLEGCYPVSAFRKMTEIAVHCTSTRAAARPPMNTVLQGLKQAWRVARLDSPPRPSHQRASHTAASGSWSPFSLGTPLENINAWESRSYDVWESRTFDSQSTPER